MAPCAFHPVRLILLLLTSASSVAAQNAPSSPTLWYEHPAATWSEALPIGNGHIGAMVFGGANSGSNNGDGQDIGENATIATGASTNSHDEHLQLNEDTLWAGSRVDRLNPLAHDGFLQVRRLLLDSHGTDPAKIAEADVIAKHSLVAIPPAMPSYSTLGDLYLRSNSTQTVTNYRRELNLNTGVVTITYTAGRTLYTRQIFASAPDRLIILHLTADQRRHMSFQATMDRPADFTVRSDGHDLILTQSPAHTDAIHFQGQVRILNRGGLLTEHNGTVTIEKADEVLILIAAATDFQGGPIAGGNPATLCSQALDAATRKPFTQLYAAATSDHQRWMQRMSLSLGTPTKLEALPTDQRLQRVAAGAQDLGLESLYFQFGRYLLVSSSQPGGLPANLQGLWASGITNRWGSKWTTNINVEMNYWMAESANLSELHTPLFDLLDMLRNPATGTANTVARKYYNARGFVVHHNTDIWGDSEPIDSANIGIWPMGGAWLTLHAWDHYTYTGDKLFLQTRAWPLLHDASMFLLDYLVDDGSGHLVSGPSVSPENRYKLADGSIHALTMAPTMDIEIVRELFTRTLDSCAILNADPAFCDQVNTAIIKLPQFKIGKLGQLQEWQQDYTELEPGHRHISHLWALYPGTQISPRDTPELAHAAQVSLQRRLDNGGGQTGWSRAWVMNYWDHLGQGDKAYESLQVLLKQSTVANMMDTHPPGIFQIDGNLGGANGILEAIVQSRWFPNHCEVDLLPALPSAWPTGHLTGVRIRGGSELSLAWSASKLTYVQWTAKEDATYELRIPSGQNVRTISAGASSIILNQPSQSVLRFPIHKGETYTLAF